MKEVSTIGLDLTKNVFQVPPQPGDGYPELSSVSISELTSVSGPFGLKIERDLHLTAKRALCTSAAEAPTLRGSNA